MNKKLFKISIIACLGMTTLSFSNQNLDFNTGGKDDSLSEAQNILNNMNSSDSDSDSNEEGSSKRNILLENYKNGTLNPSEAEDVAIGNKSLEEIKKEREEELAKNAKIEEEARLELEKEKAFLKNKKPKNEKLVKKFISGEITATQGVLIEEKMKKNHISEAEAVKDVEKQLAENEKNAIEESFFDKIKNWFK